MRALLNSRLFSSYIVMKRSGQDGLELVQGLFVRHLPVVRATVLALLPNLHRAEDVVQETFLTMCQKADSFTPGTDFAAWVCTIARFKVREALRNESMRFEPLSNETIEAVLSSEPPKSGAMERLRLFEECLECLAPRAREVMELRYRGECLPEEIAQRMNWSLGAVRVALSRARLVLKECVARKVSAENRI
jgi:RNA polymerase sigma-70 factor (ECF subfamily)